MGAGSRDFGSPIALVGSSLVVIREAFEHVEPSRGSRVLELPRHRVAARDAGPHVGGARTCSVLGGRHGRGAYGLAEGAVVIRSSLVLAPDGTCVRPDVARHARRAPQVLLLVEGERAHARCADSLVVRTRQHPSGLTGIGHCGPVASFSAPESGCLRLRVGAVVCCGCAHRDDSEEREHHRYDERDAGVSSPHGDFLLAR